MKYPERMLLKLPFGTLSSIGSVSGNKQEFVRSAIEVALSSGGEEGKPLVGSAMAGVITGLAKRLGDGPVHRNKVMADYRLSERDYVLLVSLSDVLEERDGFLHLVVANE